MLTQSVGYTASALGIIAAAKGEPVLIKDIADAGGIPVSYLGKLINTLARKGTVSTQRGKGGGVTLNVDPKVLTLYEVCELLDDPITKQRCMLGVTECSDERGCPCHLFWTQHRHQFLAFLRKTTIAQMGSFETRESVRRSVRKKGKSKP